MLHKMKAENRQKKPISDQLFAANEPAGKLRLVLFVLIILIYWSVLAQTKVSLLALSDNFLALFPKSTNFTSGIILDIILRYFSPSTILFTSIPIIIFLSIMKIISRYLHLLFPSIGSLDSTHYLTKSAFSFPLRNTHIQETIFTESHHNQKHFEFLGGPAKFAFDSPSAFVIQKNNDHEYFLITSGHQGVKEIFSLSHGEKIYTFISSNDQEVLLENLIIQDCYGRTIDFGLINLMIDLNASQNEPSTFFSRKITAHDANLLSYLGNAGNNPIHQFLRDETRSFLQANTSIMLNDETLPLSPNQAHGKTPEITTKILHENYSINTPVFPKTSRGVSRKHKHSRYTFMKKTNEFFFNKEELQKKLILQLSNHLNEQLKSFFHTSTIQISIIEIRKITINE